MNKKPPPHQMTYATALANGIFLAEEAAKTDVKVWRLDMTETAARLEELKQFITENKEMSHVILHNQKQNKDVAEIMTALDVLIDLHAPALGRKDAAKSLATIIKELEAMTGKAPKQAPAQQAPLFADGRNGLGEALFSKEADTLSVGLARAAGRNKSKLYEGR